MNKNKRNTGQALVEYALILALISIVCIGVLTDTGHRVRDVFTEIENNLDTP